MKQNKKNPVGAPPKMNKGKSMHFYVDEDTRQKIEEIKLSKKIDSNSEVVRIAVGSYEIK